MPDDVIPEISVRQFAEKLKTSSPFVILDVREPWEVERVHLTDDRLTCRPMSRIANEGLKALPDAARSLEAEIYVICHQGVRSAQVAAWLVSRGWKRVFSVAGGIDEYARKIDQKLARY
jgi:rhodanese-related sulfurtransferase